MMKIIWKVLEEQGYQTEKKALAIVKIMKVWQWAKQMIVVKVLTKAP